MKEPGRLAKSIDKIKDEYLLEAMEYGDQTAESGARENRSRSAGKGKKGPGRLRGWIAVATFAACAALLLGIFFLWNDGRRKAKGDEEVAGNMGDQIVQTWTIDPHTLLSGSGGGIPVEVTAKNGDELTAQDEGKEEPSETTIVTLTWVYQSFTDGQEVSAKTVKALNQKLKEDGYSFRIKFLPIKGTDQRNISNKEYQEKLFQSGADIAFSGMQTEGESKRYALEAIRSGKYEPLDAYLQESILYEQIPELLWDSVSERGKIYFIPTEFAQDHGRCLFFLKNSFSEGEAESFDGDLLSLQQYFESGKKLLYKGSGFEFAEAFGYCYHDGVLFPEEGKAVDPLWEEHCVAWLRMLNEWYHKGQVTKDFARDWDFAYGSSLQSLGFMNDERENDFISYQWKGYAQPRSACQTGILSSSTHKKEAFAFLELLRVDRSYARLLAFGVEALEEGKARPTYVNQILFGLDTGLAEREAGLGLEYFADYEKKLRYYEENVLASEVLYAELPTDVEMVMSDRDLCAALIYSDDFDADLKKLREKTKPYVDKVLKNVNR